MAEPTSSARAATVVRLTDTTAIARVRGTGEVPFRVLQSFQCFMLAAPPQKPLLSAPLACIALASRRHTAIGIAFEGCKMATVQQVILRYAHFQSFILD